MKLIPRFSSLQVPSIKIGFRGVFLLLTFSSLQVPSIKRGFRGVLHFLIFSSLKVPSTKIGFRGVLASSADVQHLASVAHLKIFRAKIKIKDLEILAGFSKFASTIVHWQLERFIDIANWTLYLVAIILLLTRLS